jgi:peptide/nickel transport system permease protein
MATRIANQPTAARPPAEPAATAPAPPQGGMRRVGRSRAVRRLVRSRSAQLGLVCLILVAGLALFGPLFALDPNAQDVLARLQAPMFAEGGQAPYVLGTDQLGRDLLARIMYGGRISLGIALVAVVLAGSLGVLLGLVAGYYGGAADAVIMRLADIQLAFPFILLVVLVVGALGPSVPNLTVVLGVGGWILYSRVVRGQVLSVREAEFVHAARSMGASDLRILTRHILPGVVSPVIVVASFAAAQVIVTEAALSFLGLGVQPPDASWGRMLAESRDYLTTDAWLATMPGLAIVLTVLGFNLVGDWLRDVLDPRLKV